MQREKQLKAREKQAEERRKRVAEDDAEKSAVQNKSKRIS
jgi:hypothetical protein